MGIMLNLEREYSNTKKDIQNVVERLGLPPNVFTAQLVFFLALFALEILKKFEFLVRRQLQILSYLILVPHLSMLCYRLHN